MAVGAKSFDAESIGLRVLSGRTLRWRQRKAGLVVVSSDIDTAADVAAVWLVQHTGGPDAIHEYCQFERIEGRWRHLGSGLGRGEFQPTARPSASRAGPAAMMTSLSGCSGRSRADRDAQGEQLDFSRVGWVACAMFRMAAEVAYLQVGMRQIKVPPHGYVIAAFRAPPSSELPRRPAIAAVSDDGRSLTELGPDDYLDSLTLASLED